MTFDLRPATDDDAEFFIDMVIEAVNWLPDRHLTRADYDAAPDLRHYIDDWMRPTDIGVVATANEKPSSGNDEPSGERRAERRQRRAERRTDRRLLAAVLRRERPVLRIRRR